jgi:ribosomal protein S18 acetylase RimI-like enzyme
MTVRTARPEDATAVREIAEASWSADYPEILSSESIRQGLEEWYSPESVEDAIARSNSRTLVAEREGEVVGFVHAIWDVAKDEGDILRLYVHPDHRGAGIGTELLEAACERLFDSGARRIKAMVLAANEVGNAFYREYGFEQVDTEAVDVGGETYRENTLELDRPAVSEP